MDNASTPTAVANFVAKSWDEIKLLATADSTVKLVRRADGMIYVLLDDVAVNRTHAVFSGQQQARHIRNLIIAKQNHAIQAGRRMQGVA